jgi:ABC-type polysaccharide/polyol phosphate transport system ATPase subunit
MQPAVRLRSAGVRFKVPRRNQGGLRRPRFRSKSEWILWGLKDVSLDIDRGECLGVIGSNGSGKTTLLSCIAGIYRPDEGEVTVDGAVAPILSLPAGLSPGLTGWQNIELGLVLLGVQRRNVRHLVKEVGEYSELGEFLNSPTRVYSMGMKTRLGFAIVAACDAEVIVLDEVTAVGDQGFREKTAAKIDEWCNGGKTVVMVSHGIDRLAEQSDRMIWMDHGRVVADGEPDAIAAEYLAATSAEEIKAAV